MLGDVAPTYIIRIATPYASAFDCVVQHTATSTRAAFGQLIKFLQMLAFAIGVVSYSTLRGDRQLPLVTFVTV